MALKPLAQTSSGSSQLWGNGGGRQAFTPMLTYLYLWASRRTVTLAAQITLPTWEWHGDVKSVSFVHLTELYKIEMLAVMLKEVGHELKPMKDLAQSYFKPSFLLNFCPNL